MEPLISAAPAGPLQGLRQALGAMPIGYRAAFSLVFPLLVLTKEATPYAFLCAAALTGAVRLVHESGAVAVLPVLALGLLLPATQRCLLLSGIATMSCWQFPAEGRESGAGLLLLASLGARSTDPVRVPLALFFLWDGRDALSLSNLLWLPLLLASAASGAAVYRFVGVLPVVALKPWLFVTLPVALAAPQQKLPLAELSLTLAVSLLQPLPYQSIYLFTLSVSMFYRLDAQPLALFYVALVAQLI